LQGDLTVLDFKAYPVDMLIFVNCRVVYTDIFMFEYYLEVNKQDIKKVYLIFMIMTILKRKMMS